jgi:hypothetical protein
MAEGEAAPPCLLPGGDSGNGAGREKPSSPAKFIATKRSYLETLLCPAAPSRPSPAKCSLPPRSVQGCCFRCLAPLKHHCVADCRDPLCCRGCGWSGHRLRECTMPCPLPIVRPPTPPPSPTAPPRHAPLPSHAPRTPSYLRLACRIHGPPPLHYPCSRSRLWGYAAAWGPLLALRQRTRMCRCNGNLLTRALLLRRLGDVLC